MTRRRTAAVLLAAACALGAAAAPAGAALPPIKHVFVVVLENKDFADSFGPSPKSPYLGRDLPAQGKLLTGYHGIGHLSLSNYIALISGQAPNPYTQADAPAFLDFFPGTPGPDGQAMGSGSVYPSSVRTIADQLTDKGLSWGGYMEDMGNTPAAPQTCRHPAIGAADDTQSARAGDQYATRHNPFVYFHSIIDTPECARRDVALDRLPAVLARPAADVPNYVFVTPDLCSDGHDEPCADGRPGGFASIDAFLRQWVPQITASKAFRDSGLLVVTFDESAHGAQGCCVQSAPNTPNAGGPTPGPGGGSIGAVLLSPFIRPGTRDPTPYNHYSLLRTAEDLFGLRPLGYAAQAQPFADAVFDGPRCFDRPLPDGPDLPVGSMLGELARSGRVLRVTAAHGGLLNVRAQLRHGSRRVARRHLLACRSMRVTLPRGTRTAVVSASVRGKRERRVVHVA